MGNYFSRNVKTAISTRSKLVILVIGGPCSGKSSVSHHLSNHFHLTHISPDLLIRECIDQESLRKPEARLERLYRRRLRTYNALLIHNKMTKEEKEFLGKGGDSLGVSTSFNHFSLHRHSDSEEDDHMHVPPVVRDIQNCLKHGEPYDPNCISALIHDAMQYSITHCNGFVIDGYPRNSEQFEAFIQMIGDPHLIISLDCPHILMLDRALTRAQASQRYDDNEPFLNMKIDLFHKNFTDLTQQWRDKGLLVLNVDAGEHLEDVGQECVTQVQNKISGHFRIRRYRDWNRLSSGSVQEGGKKNGKKSRGKIQRGP